MYADTREIRKDVAMLVRPAIKRTIPETASKVVNVRDGTLYDPDTTHYMIEPASCVTSRLYEATVFVGPAQSGKSQALVDNTVAHTVTTDPADIMIIEKSKAEARDFSIRRIDRLHDKSPEVGKHLGTGDSDDNTHDKIYRSGMILTIAYPSKNVTAGKAIQIVLVPDYDRVKDDAGGEGSLFDVLLPRTRTYKTRGMLVCESSPSRDVLKADWKPETPHEAPPTKGILGLFNSGDRRRHYCQCQHCGNYWMPNPGPAGLYIPDEGDEDERLEQIGLPCAVCGTINGLEFERTIKRSFKWLREGQKIDSDGVITGEGRKSKIASFWMPGIAAHYESWTGLAEKLIRANNQFKLTGAEENLEAVINTGFGAPYLRKSMKSDRSADDLQAAAKAEDEVNPLTQGVVPVGARFIIPTIDSQKHSFVVQVHAFGVNGEIWIIDRYSITVSAARKDQDGGPIVIAPASYAKDFDELEQRVLRKTYPTADGREMKPRIVGHDMQGLKGVTPNAYKFWRAMKLKRLSSIYRLVRGGSIKDAPTFKETYPDQSLPGVKAGKVAGDIPVLTVNTLKLKDAIAALLDQDKPGDGHIYLPAWADDSFFEELVAEVRTEKGWVKVTDRNEAIDLMVYALALWHFVGGPRINWDQPPDWAEEWDKNTNIVGNKKQEKSGALEFFNNEQASDESESWWD